MSEPETQAPAAPELSTEDLRALARNLPRGMRHRIEQRQAARSERMVFFPKVVQDADATTGQPGVLELTDGTLYVVRNGTRQRVGKKISKKVRRRQRAQRREVGG